MTRIVIVGGGIGGLAASLALAARGLEALVLEQAPRIEAVGAGIQLSPNATRILHRFGLADDLARWAVEPERLAIRDHEGRPLVEAPLGRAAREAFGYPYYHAHRADLLDGLLRRQPPGRLRLGAEVVAIDGGRLTLADGETVEADIVIGADGIHSRLRRHLFGADAGARFRLGRLAGAGAGGAAGRTRHPARVGRVVGAGRLHGALLGLGRTADELDRHRPQRPRDAGILVEARPRRGRARGHGALPGDGARHGGAHRDRA